MNQCQDSLAISTMSVAGLLLCVYIFSPIYSISGEIAENCMDYGHTNPVCIIVILIQMIDIFRRAN